MILNKKVVFIFILLITIYLGDIFLNIKFGRNLNKVLVRITCPEEVYDKIRIYRISPSDNADEFHRIDGTNIYIYSNYGYIKKIKVSTPVDIKKINLIHIEVGNNRHEFNKDQLKDKWYTDKDDIKSIEFADSLIDKRLSFIPVFKNILNWPGDIKYFIIDYIPFFLLYFFIIIFLFSANSYFNKKAVISAKTDNILDKIYYYINSNDNNKNKYYNYILLFLGVIIIFALFQRLILSKLPYALGDVRGYIGPAINYFKNGEFKQISERSFPYPLFILIILKIFNDFSYISLIQHILGIITGILLFITWQSIFQLLGIQKKYIIISDLIGLILISLYLFSESVITFEHYLTRESIYPLFLVIHILFLIKFFKNIGRNNNYLYLWGNLFFISNYFLFVYQPRWGINIIFCLFIYLLCFLKIKKKIIKKILLLILLPAGFSFIFISIPNKLFSSNEKYDTFLPGTLFSIHANIIDIELKKDINNNDFKKYDKKDLKKIRKYLGKVFENNKGAWKVGFIPDNILYGETNDFLKEIFDNKSYNEFCIYYFFKAVVNNPVLYFKKVVSELTQFYNFNGEKYLQKIYPNDSEEYENSYKNLPKYGDISYIPYLNYLDYIYNTKNSNYNIEKIRVRWVTVFLFLLSIFYLITFIIFLIIFITNFILFVKIKRHNMKLFFGVIIFILLMYNFFDFLTCALIHTLEITRYIADQFIVVLLSQILAVFYIVIFFLEVKYKKIFFK